ncbi:MAG: serine hydroxymethyltransferase, partial [Gammaproteobacteria bacterium]
FKVYQQNVLANSRAMADIFTERSYKIVSGGTDNHLFLVDLVDKGLTGKEAELALGVAHFTVNKNSVPNDPRSPFVTSGIRIGTPAMTTRGFGSEEAKIIAGWMCDVLDAHGNLTNLERISRKVETLCASFPVYSHLD